MLKNDYVLFIFIPKYLYTLYPTNLFNFIIPLLFLFPQDHPTSVVLNHFQ